MKYQLRTDLRRSIIFVKRKTTNCDKKVYGYGKSNKVCHSLENEFPCGVFKSFHNA